jgi:hypothetical protein
VHEDNQVDATVLIVVKIIGGHVNVHNILLVSITIILSDLLLEHARAHFRFGKHTHILNQKGALVFGSSLCTHLKSCRLVVGAKIAVKCSITALALFFAHIKIPSLPDTLEISVVDCISNLLKIVLQ